MPIKFIKTKPKAREKEKSQDTPTTCPFKCYRTKTHHDQQNSNKLYQYKTQLAYPFSKKIIITQNQELKKCPETFSRTSDISMK